MPPYDVNKSSLFSNRIFIVSLGYWNSLTQNMDIRPNHTIYINNMNDKIKKEGKCFFFFFLKKN